MLMRELPTQGCALRILPSKQREFLVVSDERDAEKQVGKTFYIPSLHQLYEASPIRAKVTPG